MVFNGIDSRALYLQIRIRKPHFCVVDDRNDYLLKKKTHTNNYFSINYENSNLLLSAYFLTRIKYMSFRHSTFYNNIVVLPTTRVRIAVSNLPAVLVFTIHMHTRHYRGATSLWFYHYHWGKKTKSQHPSGPWTVRRRM